MMANFLTSIPVSVPAQTAASASSAPAVSSLPRRGLLRRTAPAVAQHQQAFHSLGTTSQLQRTLSLPGGFSNGAASHCQQHPQQQAQTSPVQQASSSFSSAMDLMTTSSYSTTSTAHINAQQQQSSSGNRILFQDSIHDRPMFQLSSHHTSHTAAAGDLLSMSRVHAAHPTAVASSLAPGQQRQNDGQISRKRTIMMKEQSNDGRRERIRTATLHSQLVCHDADQSRHIQEQAQQHLQSVNGSMCGVAPVMVEVMGVPPDFTEQSGAYQVQVSSPSTRLSVDMIGESGEGYHHRVVRRCRRSDSFEMAEVMEDGC